MTTNPAPQGVPYAWTHKAKHITERTGPFGIPYSQEKLVAQDPDTGRLNDPFVPPEDTHVLGTMSGIPNNGPRYGSRGGYNISLGERQLGHRASKFPKQL